MNKCKKCGVEIPEEFEYCRNCLENKTSFSFSIKEKPKEENPILQDNEEIEQEIEEDIKDYTPTEETEYEKYKKINYVPDKDYGYISLNLPGGDEKKKEIPIKQDIQKFFQKITKKKAEKPYSAEDWVTTLIMLGVVILFCILIALSSYFVYSIIHKEEKVSDDNTIQVYVDEKTKYYHYKDCIHYEDSKRYVLLEEYIAQELGYSSCRNVKGD